MNKINDLHPTSQRGPNRHYPYMTTTNHKKVGLAVAGERDASSTRRDCAPSRKTLATLHRAVPIRSAMAKLSMVSALTLAACTTPNPNYRPRVDESSDAIDCNQIEVSTLSGNGAAGLVEGPGATARFDGSEGIAVAPDGTLFVADNNNKSVRKVLSDGTTSTFASGPEIYSAYRLGYRSGEIYLIDRRNDALLRITGGSPSTNSIVLQIGALFAVGTSPGGDIYVTQTQNCAINKAMNPNTTAVFAGSATECGFADGPATVARFSTNIPDVAFDGVETMFVVDANNYRIRKISEVDGSVTTLAGSTKGYADGTGSRAKFEAPTGLAVDPQTGIVYVADKTRIRAITPEGVVSTLVGGTAGFDDGVGCNAKFGDLRGITYYAGSLYAVDVNRIRQVKLP